MKATSNNLFIQWKRGQYTGPKVYIVRVYYTDHNGCAKTFLKLGFTKQKLHKRITKFLIALRRATGYSVTQYEVVSILYSSKNTKIEHALHRNNYHLRFYREPEVSLKFEGSNEIFEDTPENCELISNPVSHYGVGECVIPYHCRKLTVPRRYSDFDVV